MSDRSIGSTAAARWASEAVLVDGATGTPVSSAAPLPTVDPYGRLKEVSLSQITMANAYAATQNIGGLQTVNLTTLLGVDMASKWVRICAVSANLFATTVTSSGAIVPIFFSSNPSATTFTDAAATSIDTADKAKLRYAVSMAAISGTTAMVNMTTYYGTPFNPMVAVIQCDAEGKIYVAFQSGGTMTLNTAVLNVNLLVGYDG